MMTSARHNTRSLSGGMTRWLAAISVATLLTPLAVHSQAPRKASMAQGGAIGADALSGTWQFETDPYAEGLCRMEGTLSLVQLGTQEDFDCEITAIETCPNGTSIVVQSCDVNLQGNRMSLRSEIVDLLQTKPGSIGYLPDDFELTVESDTSMTGTLVSAVDAIVRFSRANGAIS